MKYYLDITLLPDAEASLGFLWQKVYTQCHLALVEQKNADNSSGVAMAIPGYRHGKQSFESGSSFPLGNKIRLLAQTEQQLEQLDLARWLRRLSDYCHYTSIKKVPDNITEFACFTRKQFNTSVERLARRRVKRKGEALQQALEYYKAYTAPKSDLPFINCKSLSGNQEFKLLIEKQVLAKPQQGNLNCYGLSQKQGPQTATVPCF